MRLPATVSVGMSRRLLATRIAQASAPQPIPARSEAVVTRCACTYVVPTVATSPKNTNTEASPSPR